MKINAKIFSVNELMARWETQEPLVIIEAIKDGLPGYAYTIYSHTPEAIETQNIDMIFAIDEPPFDNFIFYRADVEKFEADHIEKFEARHSEMQQTIQINNNVDDTLKLSAHAMLKQPIFKETMAAVKEIIAYCEKNTPCKKENAYRFYLKKHPKLTERIFDSIWAAIPVGIKRKRGQRDH